MLATAGFFSLGPVAASDGFLDGPHPTFGEDLNGDNRYDYLRVDVRVNVLVPGQFTVEGLLHDASGVTFITNDMVTFPAGIGLNIVTIRFRGSDIFDSQIDGPYQVTLRLFDDTLTFLEGDSYLTVPFSYVEFGPIFAFVPPHTDVGLDTDGNGRFNFIQVNISANVSQAGTFVLFGVIYGSDLIDVKIRVLNLPAGDHIIPLNFSGVGAFIRGDDGPYTVFLQASLGVLGSGSAFQDDDVYFTNSYFFTDFEGAIKRELTGTVTNATTGQPLPNETLWLTNGTHRYLAFLATNATGEFHFVAFEGDFVLVAGADGLQDQSVPLTIVGDTDVPISLTQSPADPNAITLSFSDWATVAMQSDQLAFSDNQSQRFFTDQFVGNGDLVVDALESQAWSDLFFTGFVPFNDTTGTFEVDGVPFALADDSWSLEADLTGAVTSTAPIPITMQGNFTAKGPLPLNGTHQVLLNVTYDNDQEEESFTITFPTAWVLDSAWAPANVSVQGLNNNTVGVDPLGRPAGGPRGGDVYLNVTLDTTPPSVTNLVASPDPQEVFGAVNLTATVTDNSGVAMVTVNVTNPSSATVCNCSMVPTGGDVYAYEQAYAQLGAYAYTVWATDDAGVVGSAAGSFTIQDSTPPAVGVPQATPDPQEAGFPVDFAVSVTDNVQVDSVMIAFVRPDLQDGGNRSMSLVAGNYTYSDSFTHLGVWTYTIWAMDSSGNVASRGGQFTIVDNTGPTIHNVSASPDPQEVYSTVTVFANVSDNSGVDLVTVRVTDPTGGTVGNFTMADLGGGQYSQALTVDRLGVYGFVVWARDDGGLYSSQSGSFTVLDSAPPVVGEPSATPNPQEAGLPVSFSVPVTDNFQVDSVHLEVRDPGSALVGNFTMVPDGTGNYTHAGSFTLLGTFTYTVWARDAAGNFASRGGQFDIQDTTPPEVAGVGADPNPQEIYQAVTLSADVLENAAIAQVVVYIEDPEGTFVGNFTMTFVEGNTYAHTLTLSTLGAHAFTVWAQDEAGLWGSLSGSVTIQDTTPPQLTNAAVSPDPQEIGLPVEISVEASDLVSVETVTVALYDPEGGLVENLTMTLTDGAYSANASLNALGSHTYRIAAVDSSGNWAVLSGAFEMVDTTPPVVESVASFSIETGISFTVDVDASTDNGRIVNVTWEFGDGSLGYGVQVEHAYAEAGTYIVRVRVRDAAGNEGTETFTVTVTSSTSGGAELPGMMLWGLIAAVLAVAGVAGGLALRRRGAAGKAKRPPAPPPEEPPVRVERVEPVEPESDEEDIIEELLKL